MGSDEHMATQGSLGETLERYNQRIRALAEGNDSASLEPVFIPGMVDPVQTEGAVGGVGYNLAHGNLDGLLILIQRYVNMATGDSIEVFWGDDTLPVAHEVVPPDHGDGGYWMYVASNRIPLGIHPLYCRVTRAGGGNDSESLPINILARFDFPGGTDPQPDNPGHQNLPPPEPDLPANGVIDEEAAKQGVKVTIGAYPNIRQYDRITLSWGGEEVKAEVTSADIDAGFIEILVPEAVILAAGDSDRLVLIYRVVDEVHNQSSDWSPRTYVTVEVGKDLLAEPLIINPDDEAADWDVIDLDKLEGEDLPIRVMLLNGGPVQIGDRVTVKWVGITSQGQDSAIDLPPQRVPTLPMVLDFHVANADLQPLPQGRGIAAYSISRDGLPVASSKRAFVVFLGVERGLPKPEVREALAGVLDPELDLATVVVPGEVLQSGDMVFLTWLGTRANGTPLLFTAERPVSGGGAGQPMTFFVDGADWIKPLEGGELSVHYAIGRAGTELPLQSERERLAVGDIRFELDPPFTRPPAQDGVLDPALIDGLLEIAIAPYPDMAAEQIVHLAWRADLGPGHDDQVPITEFSVDREVVFTLTRERVLDNLGALVEISYLVETPGQPPRHSAVTRLRIGVATVELPLAVFTAADLDNRLDINDVLDGAEVLIDASAAFKDGDRVTVQVISGVSGGTHSIEHRVDPGEGGQQVRVTVPYEVIAVSVGTEITLSYEIQRSAGGPVEPSDINPYQVIRQVGAGDLLVMGARWNASTTAASRSPRMLSAFEASSGKPLQAEWRYDGSSQWAQASQWIDTHPWLKLYVRSRDDAMLLNPANIFGNGQVLAASRYGRFMAMRDERVVDGQPVVDLVAWGSEDFEEELLGLTDVAEVSCTRNVFAVRLRSTRVVCVGMGLDADLPAEESDDFAQVRGNDYAFLGLKRDGRLYAWGGVGGSVPVPPDLEAHRDYVELCGGFAYFAARRASGHVVTWSIDLRPGQEELDDITAFIANNNAFAALRQSDGLGRVIAWESEDGGGVTPPPISDLINVRTLGAATGAAFSVILDDHSVRAWGAEEAGGEVPEDIGQLNNVVEVTSTLNAFCARLGDGRVVAWPYSVDEGVVPEDIADLTNIVQVVGNASCFAALCRDGSVVAWGDPELGGDTSPVAAQLYDVRAIYSNPCAFIALTADGRVVTWGLKDGGGDSSEQQPELAHKVTVGRRISLAEAEVVCGVVTQETSGD